MERTLKAIIILIIGLHNFIALSQNDSIYGTKFTDLGGFFPVCEIVKISTSTGQLDILESFSHIINVSPNAILNANNNTYNFVGYSNSIIADTIPRLYSFDLASGDLDSILFLNDHSITSLHFNTAENVFYYVGVNPYIPEAPKLYKIDVNTNIVSLIGSLPNFNLTNTLSSDNIQNSAFDPYNNRLYLFAYPGPTPVINNRKIYVINVNTGAVENEHLIVDPNAIQRMIFNVGDQSLYALESSNTSGNVSLVEVTHQNNNWNTNSLSLPISSLLYYQYEHPIFSGDCDSYTFLGSYNNEFRINTIDISTGQHSYSGPVPDLFGELVNLTQWNNSSPCTNTNGLSKLIDNTCKVIISKDENTEEIIINSEEEWMQTIAIYNLVGQKVYSQDLDQDSSIKINSSLFEKGVHIVYIKGASCSFTKRIMN